MIRAGRSTRSLGMAWRGRPDFSGMTPADLIEMRFLDEIEAELH
jgi:hypothetical protein